MRVVASLTTMPYRYEKIIHTLKSLNKQTRKLDAIYLSLPKVSKRLKIKYPPPTPEMDALCTIVTCDDYGPMTKIVGGLIAEEDPNTVVITFDDDMVYPETIVERLLEKHVLYPNSALGSSGMLVKYKCPACAITPNENTMMYKIPKFHIDKEGRRVDSIYGYPGALYVRKFFPHKDNLDDFTKYAVEDKDLFINDDISISGYLSLYNIERRIFSGMPEVSFVLDYKGSRNRNKNEISYDINRFFTRLNKAIKKARALGMYREPEEVGMNETLVGISIVTIIAIVAILMLTAYIIFWY